MTRGFRTLQALVAFPLVLGLARGTPTAAQNADTGPAGVEVAMSAGNDAPTWSRDIAPIIQRSCQQCHRPDGIGPMPLLTYEQTVPFAPLIRFRVEQRIMPPWHLDKTVGIQEYENDISLSDDEIATIVQWADAGAPEGDPADMPPPVEYPPAYEWELEAELGPPDFVVRSEPFTVVANGQDQWWDHTVEFEGLAERRWIRAAEFKPSYPLGVKVVHHGHVRFVQDGYRMELVGMGVGKRWDKLPDGVGKLLLPGPAQISWGLHYFPIGTPVPDDVVEAGVWLYPPGYEPELSSSGEQRHLIDGTFRTGPRARDLIIPPHGFLTLEHAYVLEQPALLQSFRPHMHMRGTAMSMEAIYPDGRREMLSRVNQYNHNWQIAYIYEDEAQPLLPKGTVLLFHSQFDNTANNPINPDPDQWVLFGARGVDEMSHAWVGVTYLTEEDYQRLLRERTRLASDEP